MVGVKSFVLTSFLFYFCVVICAEDAKHESEQIYEELNKFALKFSMATFLNKSENVICSPLSTAIVLLMIKHGAKSKTHMALEKVLNIKETAATNAIIKNLINSFQNFSDVNVKLANKIYVSKDINLNSEYKNNLITVFNSEVGSVDFRNASEVAKNVNEWCSNQTENKIKDVVNPETLNPRTRLMLINALYFFGEWENKFTLVNGMHDFHLESGEKRSVKMMSRLDNIAIGVLSDISASFVQLPYKHPVNKTSMLMTVILPFVNKKLDDIDLTKLSMAKLKTDFMEMVELTLPKFEIESSLDLVEPLKELNLGNLFESTADLTGISSDGNLIVDSVIQKSFLVVNENGSEAASVTVGTIADRFGDDPIVFSVNRPFYLILSTEDVITFVARVTDIN